MGVLALVVITCGSLSSATDSATRATAERLLTAVIDRAKRFNADGSHLRNITELVVFGSYLDPVVHRLGDLDLGVTLRSRIPDTTAAAHQRAILLSYAKASERRSAPCSTRCPGRTPRR